MARTKANHQYAVEYLPRGAWDTPKKVFVSAASKWEAYMKAVYEAIPEQEGELPYSAWVTSVTYNNGNYKTFNTMSGKPV